MQEHAANPQSTDAPLEFTPVKIEGSVAPSSKTQDNKSAGGEILFNILWVSLVVVLWLVAFSYFLLPRILPDTGAPRFVTVDYDVAIRDALINITKQSLEKHFTVQQITELTKRSQETFSAVFSEIAQNNGAVVLNKSAVLFAPPEQVEDKTAEAAKMINERIRSLLDQMPPGKTEDTAKPN